MKMVKEWTPRSTRTIVMVAGGVVPVLLAQVPAVVALVPALGVLRGPLGGVLLVVALAVAVAGSVRLHGIRPPGALALLGAALSLYLALGLRYAANLQASGDEPYYLLMAQSLWRDHDLDLQNNFAQEDWREYTPGPVSTHYGAPRRDGRPYPGHSPGLPVLLAPVYALGGRPACVVLMSMLAALLGLEVFRLAWRLCADPVAALVAWAAAAGPPVFSYSFHLYTEAPSALCIVAGLNLLLGAPGILGAGLAALCASFLPWLHIKMVPAAAALGVVAAVRLRGRVRWTFLGAAAAMAVGYMGYYQHVFGHFTPLALYGGVPADARSSPVSALPGLLLDRSFGLLPHAPIFLIAVLSLGSLVARGRHDAWPHLLVGLAVLAPVLTWRMWWGGQCPPGRLLVPLVPFLAAGLALRLAEPQRGVARWRVPLLAFGFGLAVYMAADPGRLLLLNRGNRPTRVWAALSGGTPAGRYLPSLTLPDAAEWRVAALWIAALLALLLLDRLGRNRDRIDGWFRGLALPLLLLLAIGVGVDVWARPANKPEPNEQQGPLEEQAGGAAPATE